MRGKSIFQRMAAAPHIVWMVMFIVAPMLFVLYFAFTDANGHFTFENITFTLQSGTRVTDAAFGLFAGNLAKDATLTNVTVKGTLQIDSAAKTTLKADCPVGLLCGIGENSAPLREYVCSNLEYMGVELDTAKNNAAVQGGEGVISTEASKVKVAVIPTNEELVIARDTKEIVENACK